MTINNPLIKQGNDIHWVTQLHRQGYVQLNNFFSYDIANKLRKGILHSNQPKVWKLLTTPNYPLSSIKDATTVIKIEPQRHKLAIQANNRRQFSFSFYRSSNKYKARYNADKLHGYVNEELKEKVCKPLGLSGNIRDSFFASFKKEQFISYHTDGSAGQYAFIYQLSKGWLPKFGGQLVLYPNKSRFYRRILQPKFNCLTLLKLDYPMPHSVRMLNNPAHKHRLTISGWLE